MTPLRQATIDLAEDLSTNGVVCLDHVPESIEPPMIMLQPAEDYLSGDDVVIGRDEYALALEAWVAVELVDNQTAATELDDLLEHLLTHLPSPWGIDRVGQPGPIHTSDWLAHGSRVLISRYITL